MKQSSPLTYRQRLARKQKQNDIVYCVLCGLALLGFLALLIFNPWADGRLAQMDADIAECQVMIEEMEADRK